MISISHSPLTLVRQKTVRGRKDLHGWTYCELLFARRIRSWFTLCAWRHQRWFTRHDSSRFRSRSCLSCNMWLLSKVIRAPAGHWLHLVALTSRTFPCGPPPISEPSGLRRDKWAHSTICIFLMNFLVLWTTLKMVLLGYRFYFMWIGLGGWFEPLTTHHIVEHFDTAKKQESTNRCCFCFR